MTERASEIIDMLTILKENSYSGKVTTGKDFTIVKDCKAESFRFVIEQAVAYIYDQEGYADTDSVKKKTNCYACRFCLCDAEGRSCQLGADNTARLVNFSRRLKMKWRIFITFSLSGSVKYNFDGDKKDLMTLIGVIHSTSIEECRVDYQEVLDFDLSLKTISYVITPDRVYTRLLPACWEVQ